MKTWTLPQIQELTIKDTKCVWKYRYLCEKCHEFTTITRNSGTNDSPIPCSLCDGTMYVYDKRYVCYPGDDTCHSS